jgi:hypothetical protein
MTKTISVFGVLAGLVLLAALYFNAPGAGRVEAREDASPAPDCTTVEVPLDEGYGVSRTLTRSACATSSR